MISYAGIDLTFPDPVAMARAQVYLDPAEVWPWALKQMPPLRLDHLGWREPHLLPFRLNSLVWPSGACRWAYMHCLLTSRTRDLLLAQIQSAGTGTPLPLVLNDGKRSLTTYLYPLPPRPLFAVPGAGQLHLLTLTDDRWRWWWTPGDVVIEPGVDTWASLYAAIGAALDETIIADAVADAYLLPPGELTGRYESLPVLLDAVACSCGQRIIRDLDGTVRALNATSSQAREGLNLGLAPRMIGGALFSGV